MPARKGSKKLQEKQGLLGKFQRNIKVLKEMNVEVDNQFEKLHALEKFRTENIIKLKKLNDEIESQENAISNKQEKIEKLKIEVQNVKSQTENLEVEKEEKYRIKITNRAVKRRITNPSSHKLNLKAKSVRRNETYQVCQAIHGGTADITKPTLIGMVETLTSKFKSEELSKELLSNKKSIKRSLQAATLKDWTSSYTDSNENKLRSMNVYYSHNVMGKRKYMNVRKANRAATFEGHQVPNFIPYKKLAEQINQVDIGTIHDVNTLVSGNTNLEGAYREPAGFILKLAEFYLDRNEERTDKLKAFETIPKKCLDSFMFVLALGGDGAPGTGTSFLISFLNIGQRVASSSENFLLFGANVDESSMVVSAFVRKLEIDLQILEKTVFDVKGRKVEFKVGELPNDMKMLAFLSGELTNSSTYFSSFANVSQADCNDFTKSFSSSDPEAQCKQWEYSKRL